MYIINSRNENIIFPGLEMTHLIDINLSEKIDGEWKWKIEYTQYGEIFLLDLSTDKYFYIFEDGNNKIIEIRNFLLENNANILFVEMDIREKLIKVISNLLHNLKYTETKNGNYDIPLEIELDRNGKKIIITRETKSNIFIDGLKIFSFSHNFYFDGKFIVTFNFTKNGIKNLSKIMKSLLKEEFLYNELLPEENNNYLNFIIKKILNRKTKFLFAQ